jgi:hypothetical protein
LWQLRPPDPTIQTDRLVQEGLPAAEILRLAPKIPSDLIVMGTHGRTGMDRLLMGSVTEQVVRKATCPVLTVKAPLWTDGYVSDGTSEWGIEYRSSKGSSSSKGANADAFTS